MVKRTLKELQAQALLDELNHTADSSVSYPRECTCGWFSGRTHLVGSKATWHRHQSKAKRRQYTLRRAQVASSYGRTNQLPHRREDPPNSADEDPNIIPPLRDDQANPATTTQGAQESDDELYAPGLPLRIAAGASPRPLASHPPPDDNAEHGTPVHEEFEGLYENPMGRGDQHNPRLLTPPGDEKFNAYRDHNLDPQNSTFDFINAHKNSLTTTELVGHATYHIKFEGNVARAHHSKYLQLIRALSGPTRQPQDPCTVEKRMSSFTGVNHIRYDVCKNNCVCFTGEHAVLDKCPECNHDRWKPKPTARPLVPTQHRRELYNTFDYIPIIHSLRLQMAHPKQSQEFLDYKRKVIARVQTREATLQRRRDRRQSSASINAPHESPSLAEPPRKHRRVLHSRNSNNDLEEDNNVLQDFWDGKLCLELRERGMLTRINDLAFFFSTDGVCKAQNATKHLPVANSHNRMPFRSHCFPKVNTASCLCCY